MELSPKSGEEGGEEDVGDESHDGDVHVRGIEVFAGWQEVVGCVCGRVGGGGLVRGALFAGPGSVTPGEEDEKEFAEDVGGCDVEVVF